MEREFQSKYHDGKELTHEEKEEKETLLSLGFENWEHRDYQRFIQALEFCETHDFEAIARHVETKTVDEVKKYSKVFFERMHELNECGRIEKILEKAKKTI